MLESTFQRRVIKRLEVELPNCVVLKSDASYIAGMLDLIVLYEDTWFALEVKKDEQAMLDSKRDQPDQAWWVRELDRIHFGAYIYPENEEDVFDEIQRTLEASGRA